MAPWACHYRWQWAFEASPEALWPLVSDTGRFNRDAGVPAVTAQPSDDGHQRVRLFRFGVPIEWDEEPFEWVRPLRLGVLRRYRSGPIRSMRVLVELTPRSPAGTDVVYQVWAEPTTIAGRVAIAVQIGLLSARRFEATLRRYDRAAAASARPVPLPAAVRFAPGGLERLDASRRALVAGGADATLTDHLVATIREADELDVVHIRPYALADAWGARRRDVLELCLRATRAGLLECRWKLLCPLCRGSREGSTTLADVRSKSHCDSCHIDFTANFERSVELTFRPHPGTRLVTTAEFCVGGPQRTPHIVAQQFLSAGASRPVSVALEEGRYQLRTSALPGVRVLEVAADGDAAPRLHATEAGWPADDLRVSTRPVLHFENATPVAQRFVLERQAWADDAATAADVVSLQLFRDLFAGEALRPGEEFSVGHTAIVFTDLKSSTALYRQIGDAVAFGHVLQHFDIVKDAVAAGGGAMVKTIGDAVMAVFVRPAAAVRAMLDAQRRLTEAVGGPPLRLKVGIHYGPCLAVTLNDRLDYFGSTVNVAARLEGLSSGADIVISDTVRQDVELASWLEQEAVAIEPLETTLKGFDSDRFSLWRLRQPTTTTARGD